MDLRSELPMHLMAAEYLPAKNEVRFMFYYPSEEAPEDWHQGLGAVLLCAAPTIRVPGDQDEPEYEIDLKNLREYTDKLTGDRGIPCGIGVSKTTVQIVDYDGPDWMFNIESRSIAYSGVVSLTTVQ